MHRVHVASATWLHTGNMPYRLADRPGLRRRWVNGMREAVAGRRVIFAISAGRTGTGFLAALLDAVPNVSAFHEPRPQMTGTYLDAVAARPLASSYEQRQVKLIAVNRVLERLPPEQVYAETSHMFIKTFFDVVADYYPGLEVVILRRDLRKVLRSFWALGYFSEANPHWRLWLPPAGGPDDLLQPVRPFAQMDPIDRGIAYLCEIEARAERFTTRFPEVPVHETSLEQIGTSRGARELLRRLGLEWSLDQDRYENLQRNTRRSFKSARGREIGLDTCADRFARYADEAAERALPLPASVVQAVAAWRTGRP